MIIAHELKLKLEVLPRPEDASAFRRINPLGKIPALVLDDGSALFDSPVICEYLNDRGGGKFFPVISIWRQDKRRWKTGILHALGDGICDAAVARIMESRQPQPNQAQMDHQMLAVEHGLDALERVSFAEVPTIGEIAVACALGYLDFRLPDLDWRAKRPKLAAWYEKMAATPAMLATVPK